MTTYLNHDQFDSLFQVLVEDETWREITDREEINDLLTQRRLWTERDNGDIQSGFHYVNRLRYLATQHAYPEGVDIIVQEEGASPHQIFFAVRRETDYPHLKREGTGLPFIYWSIRDGVSDFEEGADDDDELLKIAEAEWCFINQDGTRFNWDGTEISDVEEN